MKLVTCPICNSSESISIKGQWLCKQCGEDITLDMEQSFERHYKNKFNKVGKKKTPKQK